MRIDTVKLKKLLLKVLPYLLFGLFCTHFGQAWRIADGTNTSEQLLSFFQTAGAAFRNPLPSLHPVDLLTGLLCGAGLRAAVYVRGKNAKHFRHNIEYGSARWGNAKDIEPFMDPVFANNVILTKTERLMVCTHTLYNEVWAGSLDLSVAELPDAMKRKQHKDFKPREHKKSFGTDISQRPEIAALRIEEGHWEGDTVVGKRAGKEAVVLSLLEKKTENYIAIRIPGKDADSVLNAMQSLREEFGDKFSQVFKTITVDNGSEFSAFSQVENWGCAVYFAHPYTSWERPQNERHNGLFRTFVPKGMSIEAFSAEYILAAADELNGRPRKKLGYRTPEELFDEFLDSVYVAEGCGSIAQDGSQRLPS